MINSGSRVRPTPGARPDRSHRVLGFSVHELDPTPPSPHDLLRVINRCVGSPFVRIESTLYEADLSQPLPHIETAVPVKIHQASPSEAKILARVRFPNDCIQAAIKQREFATRFENGDVCIVGSVNDLPVSYVWVTCKDWYDPELEFTIPVAEHQCLGYEAYTDPPARRQGIRLLLQVEERRLGIELGKRSLLFELHGKAAPLAIQKWTPLGITQRPIAHHTTYKLFRRIKVTKVKKQ